MHLHCYGARGSLPVSGPEYVRYGGDTACLELQVQDWSFILDAGTGLRRLGKVMEQEKRFTTHLLLTHTHWDHVLGFPFFRPLYNPQASITIYGCNRRQGDLKCLLQRTMSAPHFPVPFSRIAADIRFETLCAENEPSSLGPLKIQTIPLSHPNVGQGFRIEHHDKSFVFLTDNELDFRHHGGRTFDEYVEFSRGADLFIHDSEYTQEEYPATRGYGHSTYERALELAMNASVKQFGLFHHNQDRTDDQLDAIVEQCNEHVQKQGGQTRCFALAQNQSLDI